MLTIMQVQISYVFRTYLPERITLAVDMLIVSAPSPPVPTISSNFPNAKYEKGWVGNVIVTLRYDMICDVDEICASKCTRACLII